MKTGELFEQEDDYNYEDWEGIETLTREITPERVKEAIKVLALDSIKRSMDNSAPMYWNEEVFVRAFDLYANHHLERIQLAVQKIEKRQEVRVKRKRKI